MKNEYKRDCCKGKCLIVILSVVGAATFIMGLVLLFKKFFKCCPDKNSDNESFNDEYFDDDDFDDDFCQ